MMGFVTFVHSIVCIFLAIIILMQSGRGGGLTESFQSAESLFGAKTNVFLVKTTGILATLFFVTCLSLAFFSAKQDKSLMSHRISTPAQNESPATQTQEPIEDANENPSTVPPVTNSAQ